MRSCPRTEINCSDVRGLTPLHWAAWRGEFSVVDMLLQEGADPKILTHSGTSVLGFAVQRNSLCCIDRILDYGADVEAREHLYMTPLLRICSTPKPDVACVKRLLEAGAIIDAQDFQGATSLMHASYLNSTPVIQCLLEHGATIDNRTSSDETALALSIQTNAHGAISTLLAHGASLTPISVSGRGLLHEAAECGDEKTLRILITARISGIDIQAKNRDGDTAWDLARKRVDVDSEWRTTFLGLLESASENMDENTHQRSAEDSQRYTFKLKHAHKLRPSAMVKFGEELCCRLILCLSRSLCRLLQSRNWEFLAFWILLAFVICLVCVYIGVG